MSAALALALWHASDDGIVTLDRDSLIQHANASWCRTMSASEADLIGRRWTDLWSSDALAQRAVTRAREGLPTRFSASCSSPTGRTLWFDLLVAPVSPDSDARAAIVVRSVDITARKQAESDLEKRLAEKEAALSVLIGQAANQSKRIAAATARTVHAEKLRLLGHFVGNIVHDMNNVLLVLGGATDALLHDVHRSARSETAQHLDTALRRGKRLVRQLLNLSRIEDTEPHVVAAAEFTRNTIDLVRHMLPGGIVLQVEVDPNCWPVLISEARLQAVILNLAANARDAMGERGTLTLSVKNCYAVERPPTLTPGDYVHFSLRDTGSGMPPHVLARAGEAYFTTKDPDKGTGLGLSSAFELAAQCGGRVIIASEVGTGTAINLYLPRTGAEGRRIAAPTKLDRTAHGNATILLLEGDEMVRAHLAALLKDLGYQVIEAAEPGIATALLSGVDNIDLACIDLQLDRGLGPTLASELRTRWPALPLIFTTGGASIVVPADELVFRKPISEPMFARAILEKLRRLPVSVTAAETLRLSARIRDKIRNDAVRTAFDAWRAWCAEHGRLPDPAWIRQAAAGLLHTSCLVRIEPSRPAPAFRIVFTGQSLEQRLGRTPEDEVITGTAGDLMNLMTAAYHRAARGIAHFDYARIGLGAQPSLIFERLILPLSDAEDSVTHLFAIISFADGGFSGEGLFHDID
ncbi:ATP-binding response regulator [Rhodopseudomonas telluris]|uniref:histidine kinase n=1 Tax=Rhodopseudomonas telluris TaxID=644215 RepID=A0ABV6EZQ5_9BRAD